jgi:elongation factor Ts
MTNVSISAADVNKLRMQTGAGMMDCKKALTEANGDFEKAVEILRLKGAKISASRADRETKEGTVVAKISADGKNGVILGLSCETDFVARGEGFIAFAESCAELALNNNLSSLDALKSASLNGKPVADAITEQVGKIGEKIDIAQFGMISGEAVVAYIHSNKKSGAIVALNKGGNDAINLAGKQVGMQIVSMNPVAIDKDSIAPEVVEREMNVIRELCKQEGLPENKIEMVANGRLNKFFQENTLLNQAFVIDSTKKVSQMLNEVSKGLTVTAFKVIRLG